MNCREMVDFLIDNCIRFEVVDMGVRQKLRAVEGRHFCPTFAAAFLRKPRERISGKNWPDDVLEMDYGHCNAIQVVADNVQFWDLEPPIYLLKDKLDIVAELKRLRDAFSAEEETS